MAGTLERVVKYDAVAFQMGWDFLASSDDEENFFFFFFLSNYFPRKGSKIWPFGGRLFFFAAVGPCRVMRLEKKKVSTKKRRRFRENHRRGHRTRARARINISPQTYGTEEVHSELKGHHIIAPIRHKQCQPRVTQVARAINCCKSIASMYFRKDQIRSAQLS